MATSKPAGKKKPAKKKSMTAKKLCSKVIKKEGLKADGTLKAGYKYLKGGRIVKVKPKPATKKKK